MIHANTCPFCGRQTRIDIDSFDNGPFNECLKIPDDIRNILIEKRKLGLTFLMKGQEFPKELKQLDSSKPYLPNDIAYIVGEQYVENFIRKYYCYPDINSRISLDEAKIISFFEIPLRRAVHQNEFFIIKLSHKTTLNYYNNIKPYENEYKISIYNDEQKEYLRAFDIILRHSSSIKSYAYLENNELMIRDVCPWKLFYL